MTDEDYQQCDTCGVTSNVWIRFYKTCGLDYCDRCKVAHDAHHEIVEEVVKVNG